MTAEQEIQILKKELAFLKDFVFQLTSKVDVITQENIELRKELAFYKSGRDSSNSSMPPSSDIKPPNRNLSLREKGDKKPGGQKGHEGSTLQMNANPDQVIKHSPQECEICGKNLNRQDEQMVSRGQLIELPPVKPLYIEHQIYSRICTCGHCTYASFPQGVSATIKYGASVEATISYFHARQYIPVQRMQELLAHLFGLPISQGTVINIIKRFAEKAIPTYLDIKDQIQKANVVGSDETGCHVNGKNLWYWTWQNIAYTFIVLSFNRGEATIKDNFPQGFPNAILSHDRWAAQCLTNAFGHQLCLSHILRELKGLGELYEDDWSSAMKELLKEALELERNTKPERYAWIRKKIQKIEEQLTALLKWKLNEKQHKSIALQKGLIKHRDKIFQFLYHPQVPSDNNGSERAIRNIKVKQKISGQFRSADHAQFFAIIRSVIDTAIKQGKDIFIELNRIAKLRPE